MDFLSMRPISSGKSVCLIADCAELNMVLMHDIKFQNPLAPRISIMHHNSMDYKFFWDSISIIEREVKQVHLGNTWMSYR